MAGGLPACCVRVVIADLHSRPEAKPRSMGFSVAASTGRGKQGSGGQHESEDDEETLG